MTNRDGEDNDLPRCAVRIAPSSDAREPTSCPSVSRTRTFVPADRLSNRLARRNYGVVKRSPRLRIRRAQHESATHRPLVLGRVRTSASCPKRQATVELAACPIEELVRARFASRSGLPHRVRVVHREHNASAEPSGRTFAKGPRDHSQKGRVPPGRSTVTRTCGNGSRSARRICTDAVASRRRQAPATESRTISRVTRPDPRDDADRSTPLAFSF